jgi:hypothetical protein
MGSDWQCVYCGGFHSNTMYKCANCGAPRTCDMGSWIGDVDMIPPVPLRHNRKWVTVTWPSTNDHDHTALM